MAIFGGGDKTEPEAEKNDSGATPPKQTKKEVRTEKEAELADLDKQLSALNKKIEVTGSLCGTVLTQKRNIESRIESLEFELKKK